MIYFSVETVIFLHLYPPREPAPDVRPGHADGEDSRDDYQDHVVQYPLAGRQPAQVEYKPGKRTEKGQGQNNPQQAERLQRCMQEEEPADQQNDTGEDQQGRHVGQGAYEPVKEGPTRRIPGGKDQNQGRQKAYQYREHVLTQPSLRPP